MHCSVPSLFLILSWSQYFHTTTFLLQYNVYYIIALSGLSRCTNKLENIPAFVRVLETNCRKYARIDHISNGEATSEMQAALRLLHNFMRLEWRREEQ